MYTKFSNGKLNRNPFKYCQSCFKLNKNQLKDNAKEKNDHNQQSESSALSSFIGSIDSKIFEVDTVGEDGQKKAQSLKHPKLKLKAPADMDAYRRFNVKPPAGINGSVDTVSDTGAMSCLCKCT